MKEHKALQVFEEGRWGISSQVCKLSSRKKVTQIYLEGLEKNKEAYSREFKTFPNITKGTLGFVAIEKKGKGVKKK